MFAGNTSGPVRERILPIAAGSAHRYLQAILDFHLPETLENLYYR